MSVEPAGRDPEALGAVMLDRYTSSGREKDVKRAVALFEQAIQAPADSATHARRLEHLATALRKRYARNGQIADLERAVEVSEQAVARTPPDSPDLADSCKRNSGGWPFLGMQAASKKGRQHATPTIRLIEPGQTTTSEKPGAVHVRYHTGAVFVTYRRHRWTKRVRDHEL